MTFVRWGGTKRGGVARVDGEDPGGDHEVSPVVEKSLLRVNKARCRLQDYGSHTCEVAAGKSGSKDSAGGNPCAIRERSHNNSKTGKCDLWNAESRVNKQQKKTRTSLDSAGN